MQEEQDPVLVHELGLGETEGFDRNAEVFGVVFQILQHGGGGSIPDTGCNGVVDVPDFLLCFIVFRFHRGQGRMLKLFLLETEDYISSLLNMLIRQDIVQDEIYHERLQPVLPDGFFLTAFAGLMRLTGIIIMPGAVF